MWALEGFFQFKHSRDQGEFGSKEWDTLRGFGQVLQAGDTVVTFNYDSTVERVLLDLNKWSPADGYGERLVLQKGRHDETPITFPILRSKCFTCMALWAGIESQVPVKTFQ